MKRKAFLYFTFVLCIVGGGRLALAAQVSARFTTDHAYVGLPVGLYITIENASTHVPPKLPKAKGFKIREAGTPSRRSQITIINGRRTESTTLTYAFELTALHEGTLTIPPFTVKADGQAFPIHLPPLTVTTSQVGDTLFVEIQGQKNSVYVGQALPVTLRLWVKPYVDPSLGITLSEADMWNLISDQSDWGVFTDAIQTMAQQHQRPVGKSVTRTDDAGHKQTYYLYEIEHEIYPDRPGHVEAGDVSLVLAYPTALNRTRDFFGRSGLSIGGVRPVAVTTTIDNIVVKPIPTADRPDTFNGAVGRYLIAAQATPTHVHAGDPITLRVGIQGEGRLDLLQAPPLSQSAELMENFRVGDDALAGVVQNNVKVFTTSIRPRKAGITQIPALAMTYFDPDLEQFITVHTDPIPIEVQASRTLAMSSIVSAQKPGALSQDAASSVAQDPMVLHANFALTADTLEQPSLLERGIVPTLALGPIVLLLVIIVKPFVIGTRDPRRALVPQTTLLLQRAGDAQAVKAAMIHYITTRWGLPAGTTRHDAVCVIQKQVSSDCAQACDQLLQTCETTQYLPTGEGEVEPLVRQARACVEQMEAVK